MNIRLRAALEHSCRRVTSAIVSGVPSHIKPGNFVRWLAGLCAAAVFCLNGFTAAAQGVPDRNPVPQAILTLAAQAKDVFRERMEPPVPRLIIASIVGDERDRLAVVREAAQRIHDTAIDAVAGEGAAPDKVHAVQKALRRIVEVKSYTEANWLLSDIAKKAAAGGRQSAAVIRNSVALEELPAALARLIKPGFEPMPIGTAGQKALPAYKRVVELDPGDAMSRNILALLLALDPANGEFGAAVSNAEQAAAALDGHDGIAAMHLAAVARSVRGQYAEAERLYAAATAAARRQFAADPANESWLRDLASSLTGLGAMKARQDRKAEALPTYEEALNIRKALAAGHAGDATSEIALVAAHLRLAQLLPSGNPREAGGKHMLEAFRIYTEIADRSPFTPAIVFSSGMVSTVLIQAGVVTLILGILILFVYRRRMIKLMKTAAEVPAVRGADASTGSPPHEIAFHFLETSKHTGTKKFKSEAVVRATCGLRRATLVHVLAACAFAATATALLFYVEELDFYITRAAVVFLAWVWPVILVVSLLWGQDRRVAAYALLVYFGALLAACVRVALSGVPAVEAQGLMIPPFLQPLVAWVLWSLPTVFLLVFLNRRVRAIGPLLLIFCLFAFTGWIAAWVVMSMHAVQKVIIDAGTALGISSWAMTLVLGIGMILFAIPGWIAISRMRRRYDAKRFSDQTPIFDSIWLFQTLMLVYFLGADSPYWAWTAMVAFAAYKFVLWAGLRPLAAEAARRAPAKLLLLRVYGFQRRTERFFDLLCARWRYTGPVQLIAAPDVAGRSIDPAKLLDFVTGKLHRHFIIEPAALDERLAALDQLPDPDARYRLNELFCGDDAWQEAVRRLMAQSSLAVMDLRSFSPKNQGCVLELQFLVNLVPVKRTVVLTDETTDVAFLQQTLQGCWASMADASPNRTAAPGALTILHVGRHGGKAIGALLSVADELLTETPAAERPKLTEKAVPSLAP